VATPVVQGRRVGRAPVHRVALRVVAARHPAAAATRLPGIAAPGLARRIALVVPADGEECPGELPGLRIDAEDGPAGRPFAALRADDDLAVGEQRRAREADR